MTHRRPRAHLTPASERKLSLRARSILDMAARRSYLDKHNIAIAAGYLLRLAEHTGETAQALMTRLRITQTRSYLVYRAGQRIECARGDTPPPVIKRFLEINKTKFMCYRPAIEGMRCNCGQAVQRIRCKHRGPCYPEGDNPSPWFGED